MYKPELVHVVAPSFTLAFVPLFFLNSTTTSVKKEWIFNIDIIQMVLLFYQLTCFITYS